MLLPNTAPLAAGAIYVGGWKKTRKASAVVAASLEVGYAGPPRGLGPHAAIALHAWQVWLY